MFPRISEEPNDHGFYVIRWSETVNGKTKSRITSTRTKDRKTAEKALARFLETTRHKREDEGLCVADAVTTYLDQHSEPRGNRKADEAPLRAPVKAFGSMPAAAMQEADLEGYATRRMATVSAQTVRRELGALQAALNWCSRRGMVTGRPVFRFWRPEADETPRDLWLTEEQERKILVLLPQAPAHVRLFTRLALTYGARRGAILDLRKGPQVDFATGIVNFNAPGKRVSRKRRPHAPMTAAVRADLMEACQDKSDGDRLFPRSTPDDFQKWMTAIGFGWVTPHVLKHSAITLMLRGGARLEDVAAATSTDLRTIHRVYRHHSMDEMLTVLERRRA